MNVQKVKTDRGPRWEVRLDVGQPDGTRKQVKRRFGTEARGKEVRRGYRDASDRRPLRGPLRCNSLGLPDRVGCGSS